MLDFVPLREKSEITALKSELRQLMEECTAPNWDGAHALPVSERTYQLADHVLDALPAEFQLPTLGAEADGHLTLDWHRAPSRTLSVSISPEGELHYAALLDKGRVWGTEPFIEDFPTAIGDVLRRLYAA